MNTIVLQKVSFDFTKIWKTWKGVHPGDGDGPIILETCTCDSSCRHSRGPARPGSSLSSCHPWETPTWRQSQSIRIRPWLCLTNSRPFQITNSKQNKVRSWQKSLRMSWQSDRMEDNTCYVVVQFVGEAMDLISQYGSDSSISYTVHNIVGRPTKFPSYGNFSQTFVMRD